MKTKSPRKLNRTAWVKNKLRQASKAWPPKTQAEQAATPERGKRKCESCGNLFHYKQVELDHKDPVIPLKGAAKLPNGEEDLNIFVERLLVSIEGWSVLCLKCHEHKTFSENQLRQYYRDQKKLNQLKIDKKKKKG